MHVDNSFYTYIYLRYWGTPYYVGKAYHDAVLKYRSQAAKVAA